MIKYKYDDNDGAVAAYWARRDGLISTEEMRKYWDYKIGDLALAAECACDDGLITVEQKNELIKK